MHIYVHLGSSALEICWQTRARDVSNCSRSIPLSFSHWKHREIDPKLWFNPTTTGIVLLLFAVQILKKPCNQTRKLCYVDYFYFYFQESVLGEFEQLIEQLCGSFEPHTLMCFSFNGENDDALTVHCELKISACNWVGTLLVVSWKMSSVSSTTFNNWMRASDARCTLLSWNECIIVSICFSMVLRHNWVMPNIRILSIGIYVNL